MAHLDYTNDLTLTELPAGLTITRLTVRGCKNLTQLPEGLSAFTVDAADSGITHIPESVHIANELNLSGCTQLAKLPRGLHIGTLNLAGCTRLTHLPEGLQVDFLDISNCNALTGWANQMKMGVGRLTARHCDWLTCLPDSLTYIAQLDLAGCRNFTTLPNRLRVSSWLDLAETGVTQLPPSLKNTRLRWRGVLVEARVVFHPEEIQGHEVLATSNAEVRRVMLERMGLEQFIHDVKPQIRDTDTDAGGERKLLCVALPRDEDIVCLSVSCPSTGRQYLLRVPPAITRCHQAAAWIAGFDDPNAYAPLKET
jgi:hypothetical protein